MTFNASIIKQRLNEAARSYGDNQDKIAEKIDSSQGNVSKLLSGKHTPSLSSVFYIADEYDVSVDWILGLSEKKKLDGVNSYVSLTEALMYLYSKDAIQIQTDPFGQMKLIVEDPILEALIKKGSNFYNEDEKIYKNWIENSLSTLVRKPIVPMNNKVKRKVKGLCEHANSESKWLEVYEKATEIDDETDDGLEDADFDLI